MTTEKNRSKVSIIGAGSVGATTAQRLVEGGYAAIVLLDIVEGLPQGKALDMMESASVLGFDSKVSGTNDYLDTQNSDVIVITSGLARKPGMSRDELLATNAKIVRSVTAEVIKNSPGCVIITVTNPVNAMAQQVLKASNFPRERVFGLSGVLDAARMSSFVATELNVSVKDVYSCVLGQHGNNMVVIPRLSTVCGIPITELIASDKIEAIIKRTINGGSEIVGLLKTGSAFYAPSSAIASMVRAVILDEKRIMPCTAYLNGEYGIKDTMVSVPVKLGSSGIEDFIELKLEQAEKDALISSAQAVQKLVAAIQ